MRRLSDEKGFTAVVAEADWPDAWRVNRYVRGFDDDPSPTASPTRSCWASPHTPAR
jgi:erythromycin esterase-like protein